MTLLGVGHRDKTLEIYAESPVCPDQQLQEIGGCSLHDNQLILQCAMNNNKIRKNYQNTQILHRITSDNENKGRNILIICITIFAISYEYFLHVNGMITWIRVGTKACINYIMSANPQNTSMLSFIDPGRQKIHSIGLLVETDLKSTVGL